MPYEITVYSTLLLYQNSTSGNFFFFFFWKIYLLRREETLMCERYIHCLPLACPQLGTWPETPGMCSDWESNQQLFGLQAGTQFTEPHQPGLDLLIIKKITNSVHIETLLCRLLGLKKVQFAMFKCYGSYFI